MCMFVYILHCVCVCLDKQLSNKADDCVNFQRTDSVEDKYTSTVFFLNVANKITETAWL